MLKTYLLSFFCFLHVIFGGVSEDVSVYLSSKVLDLGDTLRVDIISSSLFSSYTVRFGNRSFPLFLKSKSRKKRKHYVGYLAVSRRQLSGMYKLKLTLDFEKNESVQQSYMIRVNHDNVPVGKVVLSKKKQKLSSNKKVLSHESVKILAAFSKQSSVSYFKRKTFILPVKGGVSSVFGARRDYSGGRRGSHAGVDLKGAVGTTVRAAQAGKVVMSQDFSYHGKTIMIDHGFSVVSIYNHLHERYVEKGDYIRRGDFIGSLGQTGVVSGPHLHWGMAVNNIRVNPLFWVKNVVLVQ